MRRGFSSNSNQKLKETLLIILIFLFTLFLVIPKLQPQMPAILLLIGMLSFGIGFSFPSNTLGVSQDEIGALQLQAVFPRNSNILVPYQTVAIAGRTFSHLLPSSIESSEAFFDYLADNNIDGIYIDSKVPYRSDVVINSTQSNPEKFDLTYSSTDNNIQIYRVID